MSEDEIFEKYWNEVLFPIVPRITPTEKDKQLTIKTLGFAKYGVFILFKELKKAFDQQFFKNMPKNGDRRENDN